MSLSDSELNLLVKKKLIVLLLFVGTYYEDATFAE